MTTYDNLPVYKSSYDFLLKMFKIVKDFHKDYKYTLWEQLKNETIQMMMNIYKANSHKNKLEYIATAREEVETLKLLLRLWKDLNVISLKKYADTSLIIESISKQLTSWQKSYNFE